MGEVMKQKSIKRQLTDWIYETYGVSYLSKQFFYKLERIYKGTLKQCKKPISPEDLFEMWKMKIDYLNKVADANSKKGKEMSGELRIYYDLSILLSKYDGYKQWKESQQNINEDYKNKNNSTYIINKLNIKYNPNNQNNNNNDEIDIDSVIDEI